MMRKFIRMSAIAALAVAGLIGFGGSASASHDNATFEYHYRWCPEGAVDLFEDCHDNPIVGLEVYIQSSYDDQDGVETDEDGNAIFEGWSAGDGPYTWDYDGVTGPNYAEDFVSSYCSLEGGDGTNIEDENGLTTVEAGDYVVCDIYFWNWDMDPIHGGAETPNTGAGPMTTGTSAGFFLAGAVALGGLAVASRKRAFR